MMNKVQIQGLLFYFNHSNELKPDIRDQVVDVLNQCLVLIEEQEKVAEGKKKRKAHNTSGILQIDPETGKIVAEYATQKEALKAIGKEGKSGIGDALNHRTSTQKSYGYAWVYKNEYNDYLKNHPID